MNSKDVFGISEFNVIEDEENYYFFRAITDRDAYDIINPRIARLRTNREVAEENGTSKYTNSNNISLEEIWEHTRVKNHSKETNCISLSRNANVAIDYGSKDGHEYIMFKVSKSNMSNIYHAGQYMLEEINKRLNEALAKVNQGSELWDIINKIDSENTYENIPEIVAESFSRIKPESKRYSGTDTKLRQKQSLISRFTKKQYFTDEQQLEYSKTIAKLTVLENVGLLKSLLPSQPDNKLLLSTIGSVFSSAEIINYGEIKGKDIVKVSTEMMNVLSLLQQMEDKEPTNQEIESVERTIIDYLNRGYQIIRRDEQLFFSNGNDTINLGEDSLLQDTDTQENLTVEDIYELTKGSVNYRKAQIAINFARKLSQSRIKTTQYAKTIKTLTGCSDEVINRIIKEGYVLNQDIISRRSNIGKRISESVNIGVTKEEQQFISNKEQLDLIETIQNLNEQQLNEIIDGKGTDIERTILNSILNKSEKISENQYFAEVIIDSMDVDKIYKTISEESRNITAEERERLISRITVADCKKLYNAFVKAGVTESEISGYIINLLMDNGYKGYNFEELSRLENLDEIIEKNIKNLRNRIQAVRFDKILGIEDDQHVVSGTNIKLRDYQNDRVDKINEIFKEKRFVSMVLPTGAGKSFVAMAKLMDFKNSNIIFVAPQKIILRQFQRHIIKNILNREDVNPKDYSKVIEEVFPHLKMYCYDTLSDKDDEWLSSHDADFIILDEMHRSGAKTWQPQIKKLFENNPNAKILGMTATPRRDIDQKDMGYELAKMSGDYTEEELERGEYKTTEMHLLDAMREDIVVSPRVVTFNYTLAESPEYQEVQRMLDIETNPQKKAKLQEVFDKMTKIITDNGELSDPSEYQKIKRRLDEETDSDRKTELKERYDQMTQVIKESEKKGMKSVFEQNIKKKDGKYIIFLPQNNTDLPTEEYIKSKMEEVKEYFTGINKNITTSYLLSKREEGDKKNIEVIDEFESKSTDGIKLLFALDMLNEGVHVSGIDGVVMLRPINENSKILYLQQIGRCIYSLDPENPVPDEDRPLIFDVYNNYFAQRLDRELNKTNPLSDLERLQMIVEWIYRHNDIFPDINSENLKEAKKAVSLKNIQKKYKRYIQGIDNKNLSEEEKHEIEKIIELGKLIQLWDIEIPNRIIPPGEKDISRNTTFEVTGTQKEFVDLFRQAKEIRSRDVLGKNNQNDEIDELLKLRDIMSVLDILVEYGIEINNENILFNDTIGELLKKFPNEIIDNVMDEIRNLGIDEEYKIGNEYNWIKMIFRHGIVKTNDQKFHHIDEIFRDYDIDDLRKYGLISAFIEYGYSQKIIDSRGFIHTNIKLFHGYNVNTNSYYDEEGYDIDGYNEEGYNRENYDRQGYDIDGYDRQGLDKYRFDKDGYFYTKERTRFKVIYNNTGRKYDLQGFDMHGINRQGINRHGYICQKQEDGTYKNTGIRAKGFFIGQIYYKWIDEPDIKEKGFFIRNVYYEWTDEPEKETGRYISTGEKTDPDGYDYWGLDKRHFDKNGFFYQKDDEGEYYNTGKKYNGLGYDVNGLNQYGFDIEGYWYEKQEDGTYKKTDQKRDPDGFDKKGLNRQNIDRQGFIYSSGGVKAKGYFIAKKYYKLAENGEYINTGLEYDEHGFRCDGIHVITHTRWDLRGFDISGRNRDNNTTYENGCIRDGKYDKNGFNADGTYRETGELYYQGYNAYGVDENGKDKSGKEPLEITFTKEYISAVLNGKIRDFMQGDAIQKYGVRDVDKVYLMLYTATEMYPKLKEYICRQIIKYQEMIQERTDKIKTLDETIEEQKAEKEKLQKQIESLKRRTNYIDPMKNPKNNGR